MEDIHTASNCRKFYVEKMKMNSCIHFSFTKRRFVKPSPLGKVAAKLTDEVVIFFIFISFENLTRQGNCLDTLPQGEGFLNQSLATTFHVTRKSGLTTISPVERNRYSPGRARLAELRSGGKENSVPSFCVKRMMDSSACITIP